MSEPSDAVLVSRCLAGDKEAFGCLVERHWTGLRRLLHSKLANPSEADDLLQEAFLQAYLTLDQLREPVHFVAWVRAIALNLARMRWRADKFRPLSWEMLSGEASPVVDGRSSPEHISERRDEQARLRRAIAALPPAERDAMRLVYLSGLSHREAAVCLGASVGTVKVRVHRGRRRLRDALGIASKSKKEIKMIPVTVSDIITFLKEDETWPSDEEFEAMADEEKRAHHAAMFDRHRIIVLEEEDGGRVLPIWIGPFEAEMILVHLQEKQGARPMTFDLTKTLLEVSNVRVEKAIVSRLHEQVFYATLVVRTPAQPNGSAEVDCRPSDAINLALRVDAPLFVAPDVMEQTGVQRDSFHQRGIDERPLEAEERWYSLLARELWWESKL